MNDDKTKQQVVEKIKNSANILVTVSNDPSVDALSAALALTLILNKLSKHTTAIFSGSTPPAITFLDPEKTFESSTDSLRDFIIAIDKEKADHLRYKVDGDVVKIFITPYRTTISNEDLEFSQGDFNIELVLALGVENQAHLDGALEAHGRILHDATVITISSGTQTSSLGSIDWRDETASSLSEMLVSLVESLQADTALVDQEIATALLTGIVAETDRFSNTRTTAKVMTIAAQLMAAGADQQLIASKLQESHAIGAAPAISAPANQSVTPTPIGDGFAIDHSESVVPPSISVDTQPSVIQPAPVNTQLSNAYALDPSTEEAENTTAQTTTEPVLGGVAPTTTVQLPVPEPVPVQPEGDMSITGGHSYMSASPTYTAPINGTTQPDDAANVDIFAGHDAQNQNAPSTPDAIVPPTETRDEVSRDEALAATQPFSPSPGITLPMPPPVPDFGALPVSMIAPAYAVDPIAQPPERLGDILSPEPALLPAQPQPQSSDPGQFKIPGQ